jgi:hypothetical protein
MTDYASQLLKVPQESPNYAADSAYVTNAIHNILSMAVTAGKNKIIITTNLRGGLPMENINKIAGPVVESWAFELFSSIVADSNNIFDLIYAEAQERLCISDVILQFKRRNSNAPAVTANVDVKATAEDIGTSGLSPNITSFARIRTAYVNDPDYIFIILSLKHRVYSMLNSMTSFIDSIMEIVGYNAYDLKYLSDPDISYNPALGTGQIQVRDIRYISLVQRNTWEFCQLLDRKYLASSRRTFQQWHALAIHHGWVK